MSMESASAKQYGVEIRFGEPQQTGRTSLRTHIKRAARSFVRPCSSPAQLLKTARSFVPITTCLHEYNFRENIAADFIGGITTGILHVPSGLAYAALAGVDPVYGLYSSFFPAFFYMFFGTSRHCSIGSFAVGALMAGIANEKIMEKHGGMSDIADSALTPIQIASTLTVAIGLMQLAAGILRLEFLTAYFSDPLVSGFTTGSTVHVIVAQIDDLLGLTGLPKSSGPGYLFRRSQNLFLAALNGVNYTSLLISLVAVFCLRCGKMYLSPFLKKKGLTIPVPYELIVIILSTAVSAVFDFQHTFNVPVVGRIPTGLPTPSLPVFEILPDCMLQSLGMVVVFIAFHISLAKMCAQKEKYTIDARQELYALGISSALGGLFSVYPVSTALGRTAVSASIGIKTQLSTLFSCLLLLVIILWLGPLLEALPMCILASIIIVALEGMLRRWDELQTLWRLSRTDLLIWLVSFTATVVIDVMEGLAIAILFALLTVIFRSQWPKWESVFSERADNIGNMDEEASVPLPNVCVFRFDAPLIFTNIERFTSKVQKTIAQWKVGTISSPRFILDCSSIAYVDYRGVKAVSEIADELLKRGFVVCFAAVKLDLVIALKAQGQLDTLVKDRFFPTLHDALSFANRKE